MNELATLEAYGELTEPATLKIQRLLPGPVERVWAYLTESDLRRQWLAAGHMEMRVGAPVELVWRNNELTNPPGRRPPGSADEHRMQSRITELDPLRKLADRRRPDHGSRRGEPAQPPDGPARSRTDHAKVPEDHLDQPESRGREVNARGQSGRGHR